MSVETARNRNEDEESSKVSGSITTYDEGSVVTGLFSQRLGSSTTKRFKCGVVDFQHFLTEQQSHDYLVRFDSKVTFPWVSYPQVMGDNSLPQNAYLFERKKLTKAVRMNSDKLHVESLDMLEALCRSIEDQLDVKISDVYCNRFAPSFYSKAWQTDNNSKHVLNLILGSTAQKIQYRHVKSQVVVDDIVPDSGDLLLIPLTTTREYQYRICPASKSNVLNRLVLQFFVELPPNAPKEYKISAKSKLKNLIRDMKK